MVKSVIGDELQLSSAEDRLSRSGIAAQVGVIVGKLSPNSDRGLVYNLIPTPPTDAGAPACSLRSDSSGVRDDKKRGSKSQPTTQSLSIDGDWVAEHARQVSRMLLGGMYVVGVYVWSPEGPFKATPPAILSQTVSGVAQAAPWYDNEFDERLLIHISYSPRRWACRICSLASSSLRPCDFKMGKLFASLQTFRCTYNFEIRLPIFHVGASDSSMFKNVICNGIARHSKELRSARALLNGNLVADDQPITSEGPHNVELLLPFMKDASAEAYSSEEVAGLVVFRGAICASAYSGPKEPISQAILDLKGDIITSLKSRLDIITDEAEGEVDLKVDIEGEANNEIAAEKSIHRVILRESRKPYIFSFPRRVLIPWVAGIFICDYLQPSETFEDLKERCKEMMSLEAPIETSAILEPETEPTSLATKSFWDVVCEDTSPLIVMSRNGEQTTQKHGGKSGKNNLNFLAAILILLLAMFAGLMMAFFNPLGAAHRA